jgi:hypothetical protein
LLEQNVLVSNWYVWPGFNQFENNNSTLYSS